MLITCTLLRITTPLQASICVPRQVGDNHNMIQTWECSVTKDDTSKINLSNNYLQILSPRYPYSVPDTSVQKAIIKTHRRMNNLQEIADKYFITRNLLHFLTDTPAESKPKVGITSESYYEAYSGKRIASLRFKRLDPFGTSLEDTTLTALSWIGRNANRLHMNTPRGILRKHLLFREGDNINPLVMAENEKILRDLPFIEDVSIVVNPSLAVPGDVEVIVITKALFEYAANISVSTTDSKFEIINQNMFGLGHQFRVGVITSTEEDPAIGPNITYNINNIDGHFTNFLLNYSNHFRENRWNLGIERNFISSGNLFAGGLNIENVFRSRRI